MESTNDNNNQMFLCEFKELRKELSTMKKRIVQLEESYLKQQEKINILERENHELKKYTELNHLNGSKAGISVLKRKRTDKDQDTEEEIGSKPSSVSAGKKKTKTNNNNDDDYDDDEVALLPRRDNGDSFDSLSDDLLHKIVEFDGNCYSIFGSINKRCRNIYDVKEYKLTKQTCVFGYGTLDMMLQYYLQQRREDKLGIDELSTIAAGVIIYNRLDAVDWIIQLGDIGLSSLVCCEAACFGRIKILSKAFLKLKVTMLNQLLNDTALCKNAAYYGQLETLKWLRNYGAKLDEDTFDVARRKGHYQIVQYLRSEGCPEPLEDTDESSGSEQVGSDEEDGDAYKSQRQPQTTSFQAQEQPIGTHHLQSSFSLLFQINGDLSYGNNHQQQSRNRHTNTNNNNFHSKDQQQQQHNQYDFLRNDTKPMGSIREADSSTRYNTSLNPFLDNRTSHQLSNLTGNMNASIPVDSNESFSSSTNRKPIQATSTSNSSRQWNSFSSPRSIPHTQNTIMETDRSIGNESYDSLRSGSYLNERKLSVGSNLSSMSGRYAHNSPQPQYESLDRDQEFSSSGYNIPSVKQSNNDVNRYTHKNSNFMPPQTAGIPIENHNIIKNANPQQQIFYMAVPIQNGRGQVSQPVQIVQLPNGQSTFVVPANPHHTLATGTSTTRPGGSFTIAGIGNKASSISGSSHQYQNFGVGGKPSSGNVTMVDVGGGVHGNDIMYGLASSPMNHPHHHNNNNRKNNKHGGKGKPLGVVKQPDSSVYWEHYSKYQSVSQPGLCKQQ